MAHRERCTWCFLYMVWHGPHCTSRATVCDHRQQQAGFSCSSLGEASCSHLSQESCPLLAHGLHLLPAIASAHPLVYPFCKTTVVTPFLPLPAHKSRALCRHVEGTATARHRRALQLGEPPELMTGQLRALALGCQCRDGLSTLKSKSRYPQVSADPQVL